MKHKPLKMQFGRQFVPAGGFSGFEPQASVASDTPPLPAAVRPYQPGSRRPRGISRPNPFEPPTRTVQNLQEGIGYVSPQQADPTWRDVQLSGGSGSLSELARLRALRQQQGQQTGSQIMNALGTLAKAYMGSGGSLGGGGEAGYLTTTGGNVFPMGYQRGIGSVRPVGHPYGVRDTPYFGFGRPVMHLAGGVPTIPEMGNAPDVSDYSDPQALAGNEPGGFWSPSGEGPQVQIFGGRNDGLSPSDFPSGGFPSGGGPSYDPSFQPSSGPYGGGGAPGGPGGGYPDLNVPFGGGSPYNPNFGGVGGPGGGPRGGGGFDPGEGFRRRFGIGGGGPSQWGWDQSTGVSAGGIPTGRPRGFGPPMVGQGGGGGGAMRFGIPQQYMPGGQRIYR